MRQKMKDDILIMKSCLQDGINELHKEIDNLDYENQFMNGYLQGKLVEMSRTHGLIDMILYMHKQKNKWNDVKHGFPPIGETVLVYQKGGVHGGNEIDTEYRMCDEFWRDQGIHSEITHWMPLPKPPM